MAIQQPKQFYFCGTELPIYSDYWWAVSNGLFEDYHELSCWDKKLCSFFNEIEWKLDKDRAPYSYDSKIFQICCMLILNHINDQRFKIIEKLEELNFESEVFLENLTLGLLSMIEICKKYETVWWINGSEEDQEYLIQIMQSSRPFHKSEREANIKASIQNQSKQLRKLTQQKSLDKVTKKRINEALNIKFT